MNNKIPPNGITVTLCMIVKDESHIIEECLNSMYPYINRYDITDTGSTDGTQDIIKKFFEEKEIPGEVYQSDWKGFGKSRTEAFENAKSKADYAWVIDADDYIEGDFQYPEKMDADAYTLRIGRDDFVWWRSQIFKLKSNCKYVGILHEYADCSKDDGTPSIIEKLHGDYYIRARTLGGRNVGVDPIEKYSKDAEILLSALTDENDPNYEPENGRYQFYLAQSYFDSQQWEKSEDAYQKRVEMGGWEEETYYSKFRIAIIKALRNSSWPEIQQAFLDAWEFRPIRAEPLYQIARLYRQVHDRPRLAYFYAKMALEIPYPQDDILFISDDVYKWQLLDELSSTAFYAGKPHIGYAASKKLIDDNFFPENHKERITNNCNSYEKIVADIQNKEISRKIQEDASIMKQKRIEKEQKKNKEKKSTKINQDKSGFKKRK